MPAKVHHIRLSAEERQALEKVSASNHKSAREKKRARILLLCDSNLPFEEGGSRNDTQGAKELTCSPNTVYALRRRAGEAGEHEATRVVVRQEQPKRMARKLDGASWMAQAKRIWWRLCVRLPPMASRGGRFLWCASASSSWRSWTQSPRRPSAKRSKKRA